MTNVSERARNMVYGVLAVGIAVAFFGPGLVDLVRGRV
jgi:hypothetical protein